MLTKTLGVVGRGSGLQNSIPTFPNYPNCPNYPNYPNSLGMFQTKAQICCCSRSWKCLCWRNSLKPHLCTDWSHIYSLGCLVLDVVLRMIHQVLLLLCAWEKFAESLNFSGVISLCFSVLWRFNTVVLLAL